MPTLASMFLPQFLDNAGNVAAGYLLDAFDSGTTTPKATYTDAAGASANTNPIVLDAAGRCTLFLGTGQYTFRLRTPGGAVLWTRDNVAGVPLPSEDEFLPLAGGAMEGLFSLSGNATANLHPTPLQQVNALIAASVASFTTSAGSAVPVGTIAMWLTGTPPVNWLELAGQSVSRVTYDDLFAVWGTAFGAGDGSTTFGLPNLRGEFPRFWDNGRGVDAGRVLGSAQTDDIKSHTHTIAGAVAPKNEDGGGFNYDTYSSAGTTTTNATGGTETRPRNVALMAIVKAIA